MLGRDILAKTGFLSLFIFLILFGVYTRAEEAIAVNFRNCKELIETAPAEQGSAGWSGTTCSVCNPQNTKKSWLVTKPINNLKSGQQANVKVVASTTNCQKCRNDYLKVYVLFGTVTVETVAVLAQLRSSMSLIKTFKNDKIGVKQTHYMQYVSKSGESRLVFLDEGGCFVIYSIQISTFFCKKDVVNGISLPRRDSLANKSQRVNYSCPVNSQPSNNEVFGLCTSNGTWQVEGSCLCNKKYYLNKNGNCWGCPENTYKDYIGNDNCKSCPPNSKSAKGQLRCNCKDGFHRFLGNNYTHACHGIPSIVTKVQFADKTTTSVQIKWLPPKFDGGSDVFYEIRCFKCEGNKCKIKCRDATKFLPAKDNLINSSVTVTNLEPVTEYVFVIYSKNSNSLRINETKWSHFDKKIDTKGSSPSGGLSSTVVVIAVPIVVVILVIIIIVLIIILLKRRKIKRGRSLRLKPAQEFPLIGEKNYIDPTTYDDPERAVSEFAKELNRDQISMESVLGGGEFGDVYKGMLKRTGEPAAPVAIKTLKAGSTHKNRKDFLLEASVMGQFKNLNVITLEGVVTKSIPLLIVTEFMENGSLDEYLKSNDGLLKPLQLLGMARGVASGMAYLAGMHFVHRDLAARNVLVNVNLLCKVADFGLSRDIGESQDSEYETQGGRIPVRWTAPEAIRYRKFTTASDVWSYGILLWEIMSFAERPYWDWGNVEVLERVDQGYRLPPPMNCPKAVHLLMMECWESDRTKRPAFPNIVKVVDEWIRSPEKLNEDKIKIRKSEPLDFTTFNSVKEWLDAIKMGMYASNFTKAGYRELSDVVKLTEDELLAKVGVRLVGHRHKIYQRIKEMSEHMKLTRENSVRI